MNDKNFDLLLQNSLPELPPDDITKNVNPWKKPIYFIIAGLILNTITIPYFNLPFILSFAGNILLLLGFQTYRLENRFFKMGWIYSIINHISKILIFIVNTMQIEWMGPLKQIVFVLSLLKLFSFYSLYRCLVLGIKEVNERCGLRLDYNIERMIMYCCSFLIIVNIASIDGFLVNILCIIAYFLLIRSLIKLIQEIGESGYSMKLMPYIFPAKWTVIISLILLLFGYAIGEFFLSPRPVSQMEWHVSTDSNVEDTKEHLQDLGFPEHILNSLLEKDIMACEGAIKVVVAKTEQDSEHADIPEEYTAYNIAVELSNRECHWKIFHYFEWNDDAKFYGSDCVVVWPVTKGYSNTWDITSGYTGHILYEEKGIIYQSSFDDWEQTSIYDEVNDWYTGDPEIIFEFTYPKNSEQRRGYVSYEAVAENLGNVNLNSWIKYIHQSKRFLYPVETAAQHWKSGRQGEEKNQNGFLIFETSIQYNLNRGELLK